MSVVWKLLAVLLLTLPPAAYVAGVIAGPPDMVSARDRQQPAPTAATEAAERPDEPGRRGPVRQAAQAPTQESRPAAVDPARGRRPVEPRESTAARTPAADAPDQQGARSLRVDPPKKERDPGPGQVRVVPPEVETGETTPTLPDDPPSADAPEDAVTVLPDAGAGESPDDSVTVAPDTRDDR